MQGRTQLHLLERDRELPELQAVVDAAIAGRGRLTVVEGGAGAGKSALLTCRSFPPSEWPRRSVRNVPEV
jgi:hypothetical protein